jgi:hypothetical protein
MLSLAQRLNFDEEPDYKYLKSLLQKVIKKHYSIKKIGDIDIIRNNNEDTPKRQNKPFDFQSQP